MISSTVRLAFVKTPQPLFYETPPLVALMSTPFAQNICMLTDLEWCHAPSEFRSLRLETILEKYLSRGAETPVGQASLARIAPIVT